MATSIIKLETNLATSGSFSKAVTKNTSVLVGTISVPSGTWLILSYMDLANTGSGVSYNHTLGARPVRTTDTSGGGSVNFRVESGPTTVNVYTYTTIDTTVRVGYSLIKLY